MSQNIYGKDLAKYKLERSNEELDTAETIINLVDDFIENKEINS